MRRGGNLSTPPDLGQPYNSEADRARDREALIAYAYGVKSLERLAQLPKDQWTELQVSLFPRSVPGGPAEHPADRLKRWLSLYSDEISIVTDTRNRLVHGQPVTDPELRGATWLGKVIISTATGALPSAIDESSVTRLMQAAGVVGFR